MSERRPSRLNVEPELFVDPRYQALADKVGRFAATGMVVNFWALAQGYFKQDRHVPKELFTLGGYGPLLEVGLAKETADGVRAAGAAEQFGWLKAKQAAGAEGGKKSGEARRSKTKQTEATRSKTNPPPPPPPPIYKEEEGAAPQAPPSLPATAAQGAAAPAPMLSVSRSSSLTNRSDMAELDPAVQDRKKVAAQKAVAAYCEAFNRRYGIRPPLGGKEIGVLSRLRARVGSDEGFSRFVQAYLQMDGDNGWFARRRHDVVTLENAVNHVAVALSKGDPSVGNVDWDSFWARVDQQEGGSGTRTLRDAVKATS